MQIKPITIKEFNGIAQSSLLGLEHIHNMSLDFIPGALCPETIGIQATYAELDALINWIVKDPATGYLYGLCANGRFAKSTDNGGTWNTVAGYSTTSAHGNGLAIWRDYVFVARDSSLDVYGPLSSSPAWTLGWKTWSGGEVDTLWHPMLVGQDDTLYIGAGNYVSSLAENAAPFAPGTAGSYTWNAEALNLPKMYRVKTLAELGRNLMVGTWVGNNVYENNIGDIFPWNRTDPSFSLPIRVGNNGIHQSITVNNIMYFVAGIRGELYATNGSSTIKLTQTPSHKSRQVWYDPNPGAITTIGSEIIFGVSEGPSDGASKCGVYGYDTKTGALRLAHGLVSGNAGGTENRVKIGGIIAPANDVLVTANGSGTTYYIDYTVRTTTGTGYVETSLYAIGNGAQEGTVSAVHVYLTKSLGVSDSVAVAYRTKMDDSYTTISTATPTTHGTETVLKFPLGLSSDAIQLKVTSTRAGIKRIEMI